MLALDLGLKTGWAVQTADGTILCGTKKLKQKAKEHETARYNNYVNFLSEMTSNYCIKQIYYEKVTFIQKGVDASHLYGYFQYRLFEFCYSLGVEPIGVAVGTIKKFVTGSGNAKKEAVIAALQQQGFDVEDDNAADALALLLFALNDVK